MYVHCTYLSSKKVSYLGSKAEKIQLFPKRKCNASLTCLSLSAGITILEPRSSYFVLWTISQLLGAI